MLGAYLPPLDQFDTVKTPIKLSTGYRDTDSYGNISEVIDYAEAWMIPPDAIAAAVESEDEFYRYLVDGILSKGQNRHLILALEERMAYTTTQRAFSEIDYMQGSKSATSFWQPSGKNRYMDHRVQLAIPKTELVRAYMYSLVSNATEMYGKKIMIYQKDNPHSRQFESGLPSAQYYAPGPINGMWQGEYGYLDLSKAHLSIMRHATLDMFFRPEERRCGFGLVRHYDVEAFADDKDFYVSMTGMINKPSYLRWDNGITRPKTKKEELHYGRLFSPDLKGLIYYTMHAIAHDMINRFDAKMVLTDAYVIPLDRVEEAQAYLANEWRMPAKIKASGPSILYGKDGYQIGSKIGGGPKIPKISVEHYEQLSKREISSGPLFPNSPKSSRSVGISPKEVNNLIPMDDSKIQWIKEVRQWLISNELSLHNIQSSTSGVGPSLQYVVCLYCNTPFTTNTKTKKFCSDACKHWHKGKRGTR